jgi:hypothetical protein
MLLENSACPLLANIAAKVDAERLASKMAAIEIGANEGRETR